MSAKGNCYDNAAMEAFWSTLKAEMIHGQLFRDLAEARLAIFDYIETLNEAAARRGKGRCGRLRIGFDSGVFFVAVFSQTC